MHTVFWKRLGPDGHDACRFVEGRDGWKIEGAAVFRHDGEAAALNYNLLCDNQVVQSEGICQRIGSAGTKSSC